MRRDSETLAGLAGALASDTGTAARLLAETEVLAPPAPATGPGLNRPDRMDSFDALDDARRALLVQRSLRKPPKGEPPPVNTVTAEDAEDAEDGEDGEQELPEPLREVQRQVAGLAPLPRAVLVLRHLEHLTVPEIARLTERSPAEVGRALAAAETAVPAEPYVVEQALAVVPQPEPWQVQAAVAGVHGRRRRARSRGLLAALVAVALVVAAVVLPPLLQPDPYTRATGEWVYSVTLPAGAAFEVTGRSLTPTEEVLVADRVGPDDLRCSVTVTTVERSAPPPSGRSTKVGHRSARLVEGGGLWWSLGPRASATVDCEEAEVADRTLLELARLVRPGPVPVRMPFTLPGLMAGQQVNRIYDYEQFHGASIAPAGTTETSSDAVLVAVPTFFPMPEDRRPRTVDVNGALGTVIRDADGQWVCWPTGGQHACVGSFNQAQRPPDASRQLDRLTTVARAVRIAADLRDRATWFDAREVLPR